MTNESYLHYLALDSILQGYMSTEYFNNNYEEARIWYANNEKAIINLKKLKDDVTKMQKEILHDYVID